MGEILWMRWRSHELRRFGSLVLPSCFKQVSRGPQSRNKLCTRKSLGAEQCREIAMVDARGGGSGDRGLGVEGDAQSGRLDHAEIVGAVAGNQRVDVVE